ncbi:DNA helicase [Sporothrix curviconia]|uniref:DNA helicase n=1 Tax=Sporothrix curviconia TaxID=1260050 RepID=A0ABP0BQ26_9PEZI
MLELRVGAQVMLIKNMDESLVNGSLGTIEKFMTESEYINFDVDAMFKDADVKKRTTVLNSYLNTDTSSGGGGNPGNSSRLYPYVLFHGIGGSTRGILIRPEEWKSELPNGVVQASRTQLPLILAWALSIHKAQGQTLERVKVDLGRVFEKGQAANLDCRIQASLTTRAAMASEFLQMVVVVELRNPPERLYGSVTGVEAGQSLTLSNVWSLNHQTWHPHIVVDPENIVEIYDASKDPNFSYYPPPPIPAQPFMPALVPPHVPQPDIKATTPVLGDPTILSFRPRPDRPGSGLSQKSRLKTILQFLQDRLQGMARIILATYP